MYCVNCAAELQASWKHCPSCGQSNVSGLVDGNKSTSNDMLSTETPVPYSEAEKELDTVTYEALVAAGKPELVRRNGNIEAKHGLDKEAVIEFARSVLGPEYFKIWKAAGYPDINDFVAGLEEQMSELETPSRPSYKVRYIGAEKELKEHWNRDALKLWKKRGKPRVVIIDNARVMYEVQWNFFEHYGYQMSGDMVDAWYWVGCPNVKVWDVEGTMARYFETAQQLLAMHQNQVANQRAGLADVFASGLAQIGGVLANNAQQSRLNFNEIIQSVPKVINHCTRCGTPMPGAICRYCQK
jgi:hypothetical protein